MSLRYEPSSKPLLISVKQWFCLAGQVDDLAVVALAAGAEDSAVQEIKSRKLY